MVNFSISVIIPTFNRAGVLQRALDSVLGQKLPPEEIIVVDDGSTDNTRELVENLRLQLAEDGCVAGERVPLLHYIHQRNSGVSAARNRGIRRSSGEWLAFLDSDDAWLPSKLRAQLELIREHPGYRLCHTQESWIRNGVRVNQMKKHQKSGGDVFSRSLPLCVISPSSVLIHRTLFDDIGLFDETLPACEDYDLWLRICAHEAVLYVDTPQVLKYGGHDDQLSRKHWGMDRFRVQALQKILCDPALSRSRRELVRKTLVRKARILHQGAEKRGNQQTAAKYREIERRYSGPPVKGGTPRGSP